MNMSKFHSLLSALMFIQCFLITDSLIVRNLTTDQHALFEFKQQIIDPHNILANNWTTTYSVCNWVGVSCAAKHRRVRALNLFNMYLTGTISPHLGNLSFLVSLNLSYNNFHGQLPRELGQLSRLKFIELSYNFLSGEIPSWFGRLDKVLYLSLRNNNLTGTIPQSLVNMSHLEILDLNFNLIQGYIPSEISNLLSLKILRLSFNQLSGSVPSSIYNISSLNIISLVFNSLSGGLPEDMCRHLPNLEALYLVSNEFSGQIPSSIDECMSLQNLTLSINKLSGSIPRSIGNLTRLEVLQLGENNLEGKLPYMSSVLNLEELHLWGNNLNGKIPDSISNVSKLRILGLQNNSFFGLIPNTLGNLRFLERLLLAGNHLTTKTSTHEWSFLYSLANCRYLRDLDLSFNPLNGILPTSISNLSASLQSLLISGCNIRGAIPMEIGSLINIIWLDISSNELSGPIPTTIGRLKYLQLLHLYGNKLEGSIPHDLCGLKRLYELSLAANELDGPLPACLCDLNSLRNLNMSSNKLHSTIPLSFWSLKDILVVDLSSNYLSGSLPLDIGNLKVLTYLNLSRNLLSSDIPPTIGSLHDLQVLHLSSNILQGPIPKSLGDLMSLKSLDLSNNNLSGVIPKSLEKLHDLNYFNVSFNRLKGEIPSGGPFLSFTAKSFMKNYALCGSPRLQVSPCKNKIHRKSKKTLLHALRYVLPTFASIIIVVAFIIVYKKRQCGNTTLAIVEDIIPLKKWRRISYNQLLEGTGRFSGNNLLGSGSFGSVYKGILSDGTNVAIKVFKLQIDGAFRSFDIECEVMSNILHRNLVKVITCCSTIDFKALVLEFMPNGSLEKWLYSYNYVLDILQRINIMIDVALALEYLHLGYSFPVIHCDLKPSNVLLDQDMVAHVGDFGIAKLLGEGDSIKQTMTLATIGYMAPEYGSAGIISVKSDVYSYGILLMETFTKKKPTDEIFSGGMSIKHWVKRSLSNEIIGVIDSNLVQKEDLYFVIKANCITSIMDLALDCSADLPEDRLDMKNVVSILKNIKTKFLNNIPED
ncbi:hypothetical protein CRYUN_Cryun41cG0052700 [Craigia yunnanensis]